MRRDQECRHLLVFPRYNGPLLVEIYLLFRGFDHVAIRGQPASIEHLLKISVHDLLKVRETDEILDLKNDEKRLAKILVSLQQTANIMGVEIKTLQILKCEQLDKSTLQLLPFYLSTAQEKTKHFRWAHNRYINALAFYADAMSSEPSFRARNCMLRSAEKKTFPSTAIIHNKDILVPVVQSLEDTPQLKSFEQMLCLPPPLVALSEDSNTNDEEEQHFHGADDQPPPSLRRIDSIRTLR